MSHSSEAFWDRHAPKYAAKPIADPSAYEAKLNHVRTPLAPTDTVLEVGCGTGGTALALAASCAHITASDISEKMIGYDTLKKEQADVQNTRFVHANGECPLSGAPFDKVLAFSLLHLLPDAPTVLRSIHDQLRPGGLFISKTVCLKERTIGIQVMVKALKLLRIARFPSGLKSGHELKAARSRVCTRLDPCRFDLCCDVNEWPVFLPPSSGKIRAVAAIFVLRAHAARKTDSQVGF